MLYIFRKVLITKERHNRNNKLEDTKFNVTGIC